MSNDHIISGAALDAAAARSLTAATNPVCSNTLLERIATAYVRAHISRREAIEMATDDPKRIEFTDEVSAYLGDHHLLDDVAYADLCDAASEAVQVIASENLGL